MSLPLPRLRSCLAHLLFLLAVAGQRHQRPAGRRQSGAPPRAAGEPEHVAVLRLRHCERAQREGALLLVLRGADHAGGEAAPPLAQRRSLLLYHTLAVITKSQRISFHWRLVTFTRFLVYSSYHLFCFFSC